MPKETGPNFWGSSIKADAAKSMELSLKDQKLLAKVCDWLTVKAPESLEQLSRVPAVAGNPSVMAHIDALSAKQMNTQVLIGNTREVFLRSIALEKKIAGRLQRLAKDDAAQNELLRDYAARLEAAGGPFSDRKQNPPPTADTSALLMNDVDIFQVFIRAPWHGVPVRVTGRDGGGEVTAGNGIPIVDAFGPRWQWGAARYQESRPDLQSHGRCRKFAIATSCDEMPRVRSYLCCVLDIGSMRVHIVGISDQACANTDGGDWKESDRLRGWIPEIASSCRMTVGVPTLADYDLALASQPPQQLRQIGNIKSNCSKSTGPVHYDATRSAHRLASPIRALSDD